MDNSNYSLSDIAALLGNKGFGNGDGLGWLILIILFFAAIGGGFGANRGSAPAPAVPPNVATVTDVQGMINNQTLNQGLNGIALSSANNNYENLKATNDQTMTLLQQGNTNQINAIQGFNAVNQTLLGGFDNVAQQMMAQNNALQQQINQLGYQMDQCCCSIKTQMLQDRLDDRNRQLQEAQNEISNLRQTQQILGTSGRYVAWAGSGTQASSTVVSG